MLSGTQGFSPHEKIDFQLVPPGLHRRNAAERAIRTFKNHFIAGLCSVDKHFPLHFWDKLLPQAELTLNLLRGSRINPKLSAYAQLHGAFDFNRTPMAPPGIRVLVHVKPSDRTTWSPHGEDGWYTGPALESYRCYVVWIWASRASRICDTLTWLPTKHSLPVASSTDRILAGVAAIVHALHHPSPASPLAPLPTSHHDALIRLTDLLSAIVSPSPNPRDTPFISVTQQQPNTTSTTPSPRAPTPDQLRPIPGVELRLQPNMDPCLRVAAPNTPSDPPLRVPTPTPPPLHVSRPARTVHFAPLPSDSNGATFTNSTGIRGKRRRTAHRRRTPPPAYSTQPKQFIPTNARPASCPWRILVRRGTRGPAPHLPLSPATITEHALLRDCVTSPLPPVP